MPEQPAEKTEDECTGVVLGLILGMFERFGKGLTSFSPAHDIFPRALGLELRKDDVARGIERLARAGYVVLANPEYMMPEERVQVSPGAILAFEAYFKAKRAGAALPELPDEVENPPEAPRQITYVDMRQRELEMRKTDITVEGKRLETGEHWKPGPEPL